MRTVLTSMALLPIDHAPVVTVVTVTLNAGKDLKFTLDSVLAQTYSSIEYIIIDGGSSDGSLSLIEVCRERVAYCVSEPDDGIYDAMNKGIRHANGQWIIFMNAGDCFASNDAVEKAMSIANDGVDFIYGDFECVSREGRQRISARPLNLMWQRISFSHQSLFSRTEIMKRNPFACSYKVVADYEFYFKMYSRGANFKHLPFVIARIAPAGFSGEMMWRRTFERWHVARTYRNRFETDLYYIRHIIFYILPQTVRRAFKQFGFG